MLWQMSAKDRVKSQQEKMVEKIEQDRNILLYMLLKVNGKWRAHFRGIKNTYEIEKDKNVHYYKDQKTKTTSKR